MTSENKVQQRIQEFITTYGPEALLTHLDNYDRLLHFRDRQVWEKARELVCETWGIPEDEIIYPGHRKAHDSVDARRALVYCSYRNTSLNVKKISNLVDMTERNVYEYIKTAKYWLNNPLQHPVFCENYDQVKQKFDSWLQSRTK